MDTCSLVSIRGRPSSWLSEWFDNISTRVCLQLSNTIMVLYIPCSLGSWKGAIQRGNYRYSTLPGTCSILQTVTVAYQTRLQAEDSSFPFHLQSCFPTAISSSSKTIVLIPTIPTGTLRIFQEIIRDPPSVLRRWFQWWQSVAEPLTKQVQPLVGVQQPHRATMFTALSMENWRKRLHWPLAAGTSGFFFTSLYISLHLFTFLSLLSNFLVFQVFLSQFDVKKHTGWTCSLPLNPRRSYMNL